jgi:archaeosine-15-forming tRNA-guanine transglycosylase
MLVRNQVLIPLNESEGRVQKLAKTWEREDAEQRIAEVFDAARTGVTQTIRDNDGVFELTFKGGTKKEPAGRYLARGGPIER